MSRYIDADAWLKDMECTNKFLDTLKRKIADAPHIDIVRCKECWRWWGNHYHDNEDGKCPMDAWIDGDGYCSYGERKSE